jgi:hypothetical protein
MLVYTHKFLTCLLGVAAVSSDHCDFPRVDAKNLDERTFKEEYVDKGRPVVLVNVIDEWPALSLWTTEYISKHYGNETLRSDHLHIGPLKKVRDLNGGTFQDRTVQQMIEDENRIVHFIKPHHPLIQGMQNGVSVPDILKSVQGFGPSFSFGNAGAWIDFHRHSMSWLAVISGRKLFVVSPHDLDHSTIRSSPCDAGIQKKMLTWLYDLVKFVICQINGIMGRAIWMHLPLRSVIWARRMGHRRFIAWPRPEI